MIPAGAGRRRIGPPPRILGRGVHTYLIELEEWLLKLWHSEAGGVPPGFKALTPPTIQAGLAGTPGIEKDGWMSASARPAIETAAPSASTGKTAAEGGGTALMRASAVIAQGIVTTKGDLLTHDGATAERLPVGLDGQVPIADSSQPTGIRWGAPGAVPGSLNENTAAMELFQATVGSYPLRKVTFERFGRRI